MNPIRIIPRLDVKGENLVKGVRLEGLRVLGKPEPFARRYYELGADELLFIDVYASLLQRDQFLDLIMRTARDVFVPITVGGGVRTIEDIVRILRAGGDKVAINTAAVARPEFVAEAARRFGSQCIVLGIEAKHRGPGKWEALTDNGRETTGVDVLEWAVRAEALGAGEILVTSVDREGTRKGYDIELLDAIRRRVRVPVIASGGAGSADHVADCVRRADVDAVSAAWILHHGVVALDALKRQIATLGVAVRPAPARSAAA